MLDTSGVLVTVCGNGHRMRWVAWRGAYEHLEKAEGICCESTRVRVLPRGWRP